MYKLSTSKFFLFGYADSSCEHVNSRHSHSFLWPPLLTNLDSTDRRIRIILLRLPTHKMSNRSSSSGSGLLLSGKGGSRRTPRARGVFRFKNCVSNRNRAAAAAVVVVGVGAVAVAVVTPLGGFRKYAQVPHARALCVWLKVVAVHDKFRSVVKLPLNPLADIKHSLYLVTVHR